MRRALRPGTQPRAFNGRISMGGSIADVAQHYREFFPAAMARNGRPAYIGRMTACSPDVKAFLLATPFFGGLSDASLDLLVSMLVERRYDGGSTVVAEGEPGRSLFI